MNKRVIVPLVVSAVLEAIALIMALNTPSAYNADAATSVSIIGTVGASVVLALIAGVIVVAILSGMGNGGVLGAIVCNLLAILIIAMLCLLKGFPMLAIWAVIFYVIPLRKVFF